METGSSQAAATHARLGDYFLRRIGPAGGAVLAPQGAVSAAERVPSDGGDGDEGAVLAS